MGQRGHGIGHAARLLVLARGVSVSTLIFNTDHNGQTGISERAVAGFCGCPMAGTLRMLSHVSFVQHDAMGVGNFTNQAFTRLMHKVRVNNFHALTDIGLAGQNQQLCEQSRIGLYVSQDMLI
jgi:hypothetical protein